MIVDGDSVAAADAYGTPKWTNSQVATYNSCKTSNVAIYCKK